MCFTRQKQKKKRKKEEEKKKQEVEDELLTLAVDDGRKVTRLHLLPEVKDCGTGLLLESAGPEAVEECGTVQWVGVQIL